MEDMKRGTFAFEGGVTDVVERLTGAPAESFETTARRYAAMPFARQSFANRLKAIAAFGLTPSIPAMASTNGIAGCACPCRRPRACRSTTPNGARSMRRRWREPTRGPKRRRRGPLANWREVASPEDIQGRSGAPRATKDGVARSRRRSCAAPRRAAGEPGVIQPRIPARRRARAATRRARPAARFERETP